MRYRLTFSHYNPACYPSLMEHNPPWVDTLAEGDWDTVSLEWENNVHTGGGRHHTAEHCRSIGKSAETSVSAISLGRRGTLRIVQVAL